MSDGITDMMIEQEAEQRLDSKKDEQMEGIKFRVWDKKFKKMRYDPLIPDTSFLNDAFLDERFIFMQFTGIKDRNKKEIYEKDICLVDGELFIIVKKYMGFWFKSMKTAELFIFFNESYNIKILGNEYESPALYDK